VLIYIRTLAENVGHEFLSKPRAGFDVPSISISNKAEHKQSRRFLDCTDDNCLTQVIEEFVPVRVATLKQVA